MVQSIQHNLHRLQVLLLDMRQGTYIDKISKSIEFSDEELVVFDDYKDKIHLCIDKNHNIKYKKSEYEFSIVSKVYVVINNMHTDIEEFEKMLTSKALDKNCKHTNSPDFLHYFKILHLLELVEQLDNKRKQKVTKDWATEFDELLDEIESIEDAGEEVEGTKPQLILPDGTIIEFSTDKELNGYFVCIYGENLSTRQFRAFLHKLTDVGPYSKVLGAFNNITNKHKK